MAQLQSPTSRIKQTYSMGTFLPALIRRLYHLQLNPLQFQVNPPLMKPCLTVIVRSQRLKPY